MRYEPKKPQCPWRKPQKHPMDGADKIANSVIGALFGVLVSAPLVIQLTFGFLFAEHGSLWYAAYIELGIVVLFGALGLIFGDRFINWMADNWQQFYRHHHGGGG